MPITQTGTVNKNFGHVFLTLQPNSRLSKFSVRKNQRINAKEKINRGQTTWQNQI
jgi:hypothetical protein